MIIIDGLSEIDKNVETRVAIGKFDGIHVGHQKLISCITGKNDGIKSLVFTFTSTSKSFLKNDERILTLEERRNKFEALNVDYLVEYDLNEETAKMSPEDFAREILKKRLHAVELVCGPDLSFGYMGKGNIALLDSMKDELNLKVTVIEKVKYRDRDISSTRIRNAIKEGDSFNAKMMLDGK